MDHTKLNDIVAYILKSLCVLEPGTINACILFSNKCCSLTVFYFGVLSPCGRGLVCDIYCDLQAYSIWCYVETIKPIFGGLKHITTGAQIKKIFAGEVH